MDRAAFRGLCEGLADTSAGVAATAGGVGAAGARTRLLPTAARAHGRGNLQAGCAGGAAQGALAASSPGASSPAPSGAGASAAAVDTADACTQPASVARSHLDPSAREPPPALHTDSRVARLMHAPWRWYERARSALSAAFPGESEMLGPPSLGMAPSGSFRGWWVSASRAHE